MPRNPSKKKCQIPGCRNWAMRGHNHCRPHLDQFLGPRGAGAPENNVNAVKTAKNAAPFSAPQINQIALQITQNPDQIKQTLHGAIDGSRELAVGIESVPNEERYQAEQASSDRGVRGLVA